MPKKLHMTWVPAGKRWLKGYKGKTYSVSCRQLGVVPSKEGSWLAANQWWEAKQVELDAGGRADPVKVAEARMNGILDGLDAAALRALIEKANAAKVLLATLGMRDELGEVPAAPFNAELEHGMLTRAVEKVSDRPAAEADRAVGAQVDKWLTLLKSSGMNPATLRYYRYSVGRFRDWIGAGKDVGVITGPKLEEFLAHLGVRMAEGMSPATANETMKTARQFAGRLAELGMIPLPGNLQSRRLRIGVPAAPVPTASPDDVKRLLAACSGRRAKTKLFILLGLNCGMLQADITDLRNGEVDWRAGTVTRERAKRAGKSGALTVAYKLWPETLAELKKYRQPGDLVLRTAAGRPLCGRWIEAGRVRAYDNISQSWRTAAAAAGVGLAFKVLRKTGASKLAEHPQFKFYAQYFLAHAPASVADRHYVKPNEAEFFIALEWLRGQFLDG